jgi:aerobic-type carbon monoxide dehydrogenase small subunit (CoxS/CutS family)
MIIAARAFLNICAHDDSKEQLVDEQAVRLALSGNICRCTGYVQIVNAVLSVAQQENRNV